MLKWTDINSWWKRRCDCISDSVAPDFLCHHGLYPTRHPCPWNSPGKHTGVGTIPFSRGSSWSRDWTQVSLPHCRHVLYYLSHQGSPNSWQIHIIHEGQKCKTSVFKWYVCVHARSLQSCPTLCDTMDYSLPGSSVHGIIQVKILEWVAMPSFRGSSQSMTHGWNPCLSYLLHLQVGSRAIWETHVSYISQSK